MERDGREGGKVVDRDRERGRGREREGVGCSTTPLPEGNQQSQLGGQQPSGDGSAADLRRGGSSRIRDGDTECWHNYGQIWEGNEWVGWITELKLNAARKVFSNRHSTDAS